MTEDEMVGCYHQLHGNEFEYTLGVVMDREAWRAAVQGTLSLFFFNINLFILIGG